MPSTSYNSGSAYPKSAVHSTFSKKEIEKQKINNRTRTDWKSNNLRDFLTLVFSNSGHF